MKLGEVATEIRDRINSSQISIEQYVTTENMVKDRGGVVVADSMPNDVGLVRYRIGDVLIANIRPYLKKIWLSNCEGGCSSDVVVYRTSTSELSSEYLHSALSSDDFFDYVMRKTRGTKMPRGDRDWMLQFELPLPPLAVQREIVARLEKDLAMVERMANGFEVLKTEADQLFKSTLKETFEEVSRGGAETRRLGDVCDRLSSGKNITAKDVREFGTYPVYGANGLRGYSEVSNFEGECCVIGRQGALCGNVRYFAGKAYMSDHAVVAMFDATCETKYMLYQLKKMDLGKLSSQAAQPGLSVRDMAEQEIFLPPLPTQRKIVAKLDAVRERCEKLKRAAEEGLQTAALMRKAILKEAFA